MEVRGNAAGCFDIEESEWADATELTNVKVAGLGKYSYLVGERQESRLGLQAVWVVLREQFYILASCCLNPMSRNSGLELRRVES